MPFLAASNTIAWLAWYYVNVMTNANDHDDDNDTDDVTSKYIMMTESGLYVIEHAESGSWGRNQNLKVVCGETRRRGGRGEAGGVHLVAVQTN